MRPPSPLHAKVLYALDGSLGVFLSSEGEATREETHTEVEVNGLVPLTEVAVKAVPRPQLE